MEESEIFSDLYAGSYDSIYGAKDYLAECNVIERAFALFGDGQIKRIADFGCGTGSHAVPLAGRGFVVAGVDRSEAMLAEARAKAGRAAGASRAVETLAFHQGDLREIDLQSKFDAVLMMFAVLGYQHTNEDVTRTLVNVKRHVRQGGLLLCDIWYGPAVLHVRPSPKLLEIRRSRDRLIRIASTEIDVLKHLCTVTYSLIVIEGDRVVSEGTERHQMRFFFPQEITALLELAGFRVCRLSAFPDVERTPNEDDWNALVVARADA